MQKSSTLKRSFRSLLYTLYAVFAFAAGSPAMAAPEVVATILPVQSLVWGVMKDVGKPHLLVPVGASPHSYTLKPSDALALRQSRLVFRVDPHFEQFLNAPLDNIAQDAKVVTLAKVPGLHLRETEDHHSTSDAHEHELDPHIWLDPVNVRLWVDEIARALSEADPDNSESYERNAQAITAELAALTEEISRMLEPVTGKPYLVHHDAYGYFEERFAMRNIGAISLDVERPASARHLHELRQALQRSGAKCIFVEPQLSAKLAQMLANDVDARIATLDPLGEQRLTGVANYTTMLRNLARSLRDCLAIDG